MGAETQLTQLNREKHGIESKMIGGKKRLGELQNTIRSRAEEIKSDEMYAARQENSLQNDQDVALKEAESSQMQEHVDRLTVQLAKEHRLRESDESRINKSKKKAANSVAHMSAKLHAVDAAAVAVVQMIKKVAGKKKGGHNKAKLEKDIKVARKQRDQLQDLMSVAEKKVMKAVSKVKLAKASKMPKAIHCQ